MDVEQRLAATASAIAEPARARMLCALMDRHARTAIALRRRWLTQDLEGRGVRPTPKGRRDWLSPLGVEAAA